MRHGGSKLKKDDKGHYLQFGFPIHKQNSAGTHCSICGKKMEDKSGELKPYRFGSKN